MKSYPKFVKYESICSVIHPQSLEGLLGNNYSVFEKIDGGNCQVRRSGYDVLGGSRANFLTGPTINSVPWFGKFMKWVRTNYAEFLELPEDKVVFGEWLGNHTIKYNPENEDNFFVIDVLDLNNNRFLPYLEGVEFLNAAGFNDIMRYLPVLHQGEVSEENIQKFLSEPSDYYPGNKEGVVIKDYNSDEQQFFKVLHQDYAEIVALRDGRSDFLPPQRFVKNYYRLRDVEGQRKVNYDSLVQATVENIRKEAGVDLDINEVRKRLHKYIKCGKLDELKFD